MRARVEKLKSQIYIFYFHFWRHLAHGQHFRVRFEWDDRKAHKLNRSHIWPTWKTIYAWPEPNIKAKSRNFLTFRLCGERRVKETSLNPRKLHFPGRNINNLWHTQLKHQSPHPQVILSISIRQRDRDWGREPEVSRHRENVSKWKKWSVSNFNDSKTTKRKLEKKKTGQRKYQ